MVELNKIPHIEEIANRGVYGGAAAKPTQTFQARAAVSDKLLPSLEDAIRADETVTVLMGEKVEPRKAFIEEKAKYAVNLDF